MKRIYKQKNVLEAATERIEWIFDNFENVSVSVSGGKDSCVIFDMAHKEAIKRNRQIECFFLDEEAIYKSSVEIVRHQMDKPNVIKKWYQLPIKHFNATSYNDDFLHCFNGIDEPIHGYQEDSIRSCEYTENGGDRFYGFLKWYPTTFTEKTALIVGLRSNESLNRYRAVTKNPSIESVNWSTKTDNPLVHNLYPIYDWGFDDIWRYIYDNDVKYSKIYDFQFAKDYKKEEMRVSSLLHEMSFKSLVDLPEFEPDTYEKLCDRISGVNTARIYAKEKLMYAVDKLPKGYKDWIEYRNFLLENYPNEKYKAIYTKKFKHQPINNDVAKQQVRKMLINDWEDTAIQIDTDQEEKRKQTKQKWIDIL